MVLFYSKGILLLTFRLSLDKLKKNLTSHSDDGAKHECQTPREPMVGENRQLTHVEHSGAVC